MASSARRRRIALLALALASGAAHALIGGWLFGHHENHPPGSAMPTATMQVVPAPADERAGNTRTDASPAVDAASPSPGIQASASAAQATTRYFDTSEVDHEAQPIPDWTIDAPGLYSVGLRRAVMQVFVSDAGQAVRCVVESAEPESLMGLVKESLERQVCSTPLDPAVRDGRAVASVRRIELLVTP